MEKTLINDGMFLDQDCKFEIEGKTFESGGAFIGMDKNGKLGGSVYADDSKGVVSNWHGNIKIPASFGKVFRSNFGDRRRAVYFKYSGRSFFGMYCGIDFNQLVNVREIKR